MKCTSDNDDSGAALIGVGVLALTALVLCPPLVPFSVLAYPLFCGGGEGDDEVDSAAKKHADRVAEDWKRTRKPGEQGVTVSATVDSSRGASGTRTYRYELDEDER